MLRATAVTIRIERRARFVVMFGIVNGRASVLALFYRWACAIGSPRQLSYVQIVSRSACKCDTGRFYDRTAFRHPIAPIRASQSRKQAFRRRRVIPGPKKLTKATEFRFSERSFGRVATATGQRQVRDRSAPPT
jgi:hypothetical protein